MSRRDPLRRHGFAQPPHGPPEPALPVGERVALIVVAVIAMGAAIYSVHSSSSARAAQDTPVSEVVAAPGRPIASEAQVFRIRPGMLAARADAPRRATAHPRTLATYRGLRSYPGAPPRVPHGLTADEFRTGRCNTCHERGGYVQRFGAYAPVSPHPELSDCLQCHAMDDALVGAPIPHAGPNDTCRQCHAGIPARFREAGLNWRTAPWPGITGAGGMVPTISHDLEMRGNCLACHIGPGAVSEIRVSHPERANCRQCHVPAERPSGVFIRPGPAAGDAGGGAP